MKLRTTISIALLMLIGASIAWAFLHPADAPKMVAWLMQAIPIGILLLILFIVFMAFFIFG